MESKKISKKLLKQTGENFGAYKICGENCYYYENIVHYVKQYIYYKDSETFKKLCSEMWSEEREKDVTEFKKFIKEIAKKYDYASDTQLFYSCGLYGNTGQLHKITCYNRKNDNQESFFLYY